MPAEVNNPPCPVHGAFPRALHEESFQGAVEVLEQLLATVSGVGTTTYTRCPYGYEANFNGLVRALEDLNASISGIQGGGGGGALNIVGKGGTSVTVSGSYYVISSVSGPFVGSGLPSSPDYGSLWYKQDQGRLLVYASGNSAPAASWYQTNAEPIIYKSEVPPSGTGHNAPLRDGFLWFNSLLGNILVYDAVSSGWYEPAARRAVAYRDTPPTAVVGGEVWYDTSTSIIKIWNGTQWTSLLDPPSPTKTTVSTSAVVLDSYSATSVGPKTYSIAVSRGTEVQNSDITLIHNSSNAYTSQHSIVYSSGTLAAFSGRLVDGYVQLVGYSNSIDQTVFRPIIWTGTDVTPSTTTATSGLVIDSYPVTFSGTKTYSINVARGSDVQNSDLTVINTATTGFTSEHSVVYSSGSLATFSGEVYGGNVNIVAYSASTSPTTYRPVVWGNPPGIPLTSASVSGALIDQYPVQASGTKTITVNVNRGGEVQTSDLTIVHTPSDVYLSEHSAVYSSGTLASFSGLVIDDFVSIVAYSSSAAPTTFRPYRVTP